MGKKIIQKAGKYFTDSGSTKLFRFICNQMYQSRNLGEIHRRRRRAWATSPLDEN